MIKQFSIFPLILLLTVFLLSSCQSDQNGRTLLRIGNKQYNKGQYNDSESSYLKSIEKGASPEALYGRGNSSQCLLPSLPSSNLSATDSVVLSSYQYALEQTSGNSIKQSKIYHNMGNLCYQAGLRNQKTQHLDESSKKFSESVEYYKSSLRLNPSDDETRYNLCMAMYMLDKNKKDQENQKQNQDQSQNSDKENQDKQQDQNKDDQEKDKNKKDQNKKEDSDNSDSDKQENKDKENKDQQKNKDKEQESNKDKENGKEKKEPEKKKENEKENPQNNQSSPSGQNKDKESSSSRSNNVPNPKGGIDKKTANQLLNAAQQDENKVQKKIEKAIGVGGSYEKDW